MTMAGECAAIPVANARPPDGPYALQTNFDQFRPTDHSRRSRAASKRPFTDVDTHSSFNVTHGGPNGATYASPAMFTPTNAHIVEYATATISPLETRFDIDHESPGSDSRYSFDSQIHHGGAPAFATFTNSTDPLSSKRRCDSLQSNYAAHSPTMPHAQVGRRRGSEYAEPGSARAIYLEKNRKAASKCRGKQKRQQEELVEAARDVERRNKILKAEVEILKSGMQDLMQLVGQHTECPDTRLKQYLQREADRLAMGGQQNRLSSPMSGSPYSGTGFINKIPSSEDG